MTPRLTGTFDVIVIGVGAMGSSACYHLARRGVRVLGLEQFDIPHDRGSSHGGSRLIRLCYAEHPDYVPLLQRAYQLWDELEQASGRTLLYKTGGLYMGPADGELVAGTLRAAQLHRLPHQVVSRAELASAYPQFQVPDDYRAVLEPEAGLLLPEEVVTVQARLAREHGAEVHVREPVVDWSQTPDGVTIRTANATYAADRVILCGGAWSTPLIGTRAATSGLPLQVTRQVTGWVLPKTPQRFSLGSLPVWAIASPDGGFHYGVPILPDGVSAPSGFKIACHRPGEPTTAEGIDRRPRPHDEASFRDVLRRWIPDADGPLLSMAVCMYTNTPDSHFVIDIHPECDRAVIACGFSGHGFKFASVVGEVLADLAMHGRSAQPTAFLRAARFVS